MSDMILYHYALSPFSEKKGVLVADLAYSWILQRTMNASSTVHVHFPKQGFTLRPE